MPEKVKKRIIYNHDTIFYIFYKILSTLQKYINVWNFMSSNFLLISFLHALFSFLPFNTKCVSRWIIFKMEKKKKKKWEFIRENCQRRSSTEMRIDEVGWDDTRWVLWTLWWQRSVDIRVINVAYELQILHEEHC